MDKIKSVFSPGSKADDNVLYGDGNSENLGKVAGEGSHFGHSRTTEPSVTTGSAAPTAGNAPAGTSALDTSRTAALNTGTGPTTLGSDTQTPSPDATRAAQLAAKSQTHDSQTTVPSNTHDARDATAGLAASRADTSRQTQNLPDRTAGQTQTSHPIYDQFSGTSSGTSGHPQAQSAAASAAGAAAPSSTYASSPYSSHAVDPRVDPQSKTPQKHHVGRDAALGAGAVGAAGTAAYGGDKLHGEHEQRSTQPTAGAHQADNSPAVHANQNDPSVHVAPTVGAQDLGDSQGVQVEQWMGEGSRDSLSRQPPPAPAGMSQASSDPRSGSATYGAGASSQPSTLSAQSGTTQQQPHHYGRDAALGGGVGAAGVGSYEVLKHHGTSTEPQTATVGHQSQAPAGLSQGVPPSSISEPRSTALQSEPQQQQRTGAGYYTQPQGTAVETEQSKDHHYGRDAAIGTGAGVAGVGGYGALKHHNDNVQQHPTQGNFGTAHPSTTQNTTPGLATTTDTRQPAPTAREQKSDEHHYGRDAAIGAGAAGAGAAAYEAKMHEDEKKALEQQQRAEKEHQKQLAAEEKEHAKEQKKAEKEHEKAVKQHEKEVKKEEKQHEKEVKKEEKQHEKEIKAAEAEREKQAKEHDRAVEEERKRREKEAAGAAGVGATGLAAEEYERKKDKDNEAEDEGKKKGGILGIFSRDKKDKDVEDDKHDKHKKEEEAIVGAGAVGTAAAGKHEHDKRKEAENVSPATTHRTDTTESEEGKKKGGLLSKILPTGKKDKDVDDHETEKPKDHHREKGAAAGVGAVGAAAVGKYEYDEHRDGQQPMAASEGTQAAGGTTVTRGSLGQLQAREAGAAPPTQATTQPPAGEKIYTDSLGGLHRVADDTTSPAGQDQSHRGAEVAAGAGVLGTEGVGAHDYNKRQQAPYDTTRIGTVPGQTSRTYEHQPTQAYDEREQSHHYGRDAAIGAGAVGTGVAGKHEYDRHHGEDLGASQGQASEGYYHPKTEKDIAAEKRNDTPAVGALHREGRLHGKEGGAPGAVGVPPNERDEGYAETQRHPHQEEEHKKHGILGGIFHRQKDDKDEKEIETSTSHSDRHRLHKVR